VSLDAILDGPRPIDPARDQVWLALRREVDTLTVGGPYDPRRLFGMSDAQVAQWRVERRAWLARQLAGDGRVEV
jgi:hypothetical protein